MQVLNHFQIEKGWSIEKEQVNATESSAPKIPSPTHIIDLAPLPIEEKTKRNERSKKNYSQEGL